MARYISSDSGDFRRLLLRGFGLALLVALVVGAVAFFVSRQSTPLYEAESTLILYERGGTAAESPSLYVAPDLAVETYQGALSSRTMLSEALASLDGSEPDAMSIARLRDALTVQGEDGAISALLSIIVRHPRPERARDLSNALASRAVAWDVERAERALDATVDGLRAQLVAAEGGGEASQEVAADLREQLARAQALRAGVGSRLSVFEAAVIPSSPVAPTPLRNAFIAAVLAFVVTYAILMVRTPLLREEQDVGVTARERPWLGDATR